MRRRRCYGTHRAKYPFIASQAASNVLLTLRREEIITAERDECGDAAQRYQSEKLAFSVAQALAFWPAVHKGKMNHGNRPQEGRDRAARAIARSRVGVAENSPSTVAG
jgi:hypothetical protein